MPASPSIPKLIACTVIGKNSACYRLVYRRAILWLIHWREAIWRRWPIHLRERKLCCTARIMICVCCGERSISSQPICSTPSLPHDYLPCGGLVMPRWSKIEEYARNDTPYLLRLAEKR